MTNELSFDIILQANENYPIKVIFAEVASFEGNEYQTITAFLDNDPFLTIVIKNKTKFCNISGWSDLFNKLKFADKVCLTKQLLVFGKKVLSNDFIKNYKYCL